MARETDPRSGLRSKKPPLQAMSFSGGSFHAGTNLYADPVSAVNPLVPSRYTPQEMMRVIESCRGSVSIDLDKYEQLALKQKDEPPSRQSAAASEAERLVTLLGQMDTMLAQETP